MGHADKLTVVNTLNGVACGAHLAVHLKPAAEGAAVIRGEQTKVTPLDFHGVDDIGIESDGSGYRRGSSDAGSGGHLVAVLQLSLSVVEEFPSAAARRKQLRKKSSCSRLFCTDSTEKQEKSGNLATCCRPTKTTLIGISKLAFCAVALAGRCPHRAARPQSNLVGTSDPIEKVA
mmetsp:Transcript_43066/g.131154  ORF Transcript_43066/g.131154 Transcript_43066/m.131154 type:complete len:175 (-) Transcript_43066:156-680(-)